jgi:UDP-N-acetylmuramoyl-tripeptide--D-alanyl-D-alanine ligase
VEPLTLAETAAAAGGALRGGGETLRILSVSTDSRDIRLGALFVALKGPRFDGHDHVAAAVGGGAVAALVARGRLPEASPLRRIEVEDPLAALGRLAAAYRLRFSPRVVGITGSNGKTTTKEMLAAICRAAGPTVYSPRSFNNAIGLPLTCFELLPATRYAVLEMGANAPGEIAGLAAIAFPDVAVVTNVARAHLGGFGGTLEGVARAKGELVEAVARRGGTVVLNADDPNSRPLFARAKGAKVVAFRHDAVPGMRGRHNEMNAQAALAAAKALGIPLGKAAAALQGFQTPPMRLEEQAAGGVRLVNDAYNANPDSMQAALDWLASQKDRRIACLGEMLELGEDSETLHRKTGEAAAKAGVDLLVAVGKPGAWIAEGFRKSDGKEVLLALDAEEAGRLVRDRMRPGDVVLFKGSRGVALEKAVHLVEEACRR